jgi:hypothetical protein
VPASNRILCKPFGAAPRWQSISRNFHVRVEPRFLHKVLVQGGSRIISAALQEMTGGNARERRPEP